MHDIDFLPSECRRDYDRRKWSNRRLLIITLLVAVVAAVAWNQQQRLHRLQAQLARCEPSRASAVQTKEALNELQSQLQLARASADLIAYVRHPWPRTQILAAILRHLPDEVTFEQLHVGRETGPRTRSAERRSRSDLENEDQDLAGLPPAARDLKRLRDEFDSRQVTVTITGVTTDAAALHQYLAALGREGLFTKSQLQSIEADTSVASRLRFRATVLVRPGYGQPGGPSDPNPNAVALTRRRSS